MKSESLELTMHSQDDLPAVSKKILDYAGSCRILLFDAPMGAGKTTLIKAICRELGSHDDLSSPTYSVVNTYKGTDATIYHMDLFRVNSATELMDIGIEEYLDSGDYCFIEWPALAKDLVETDWVEVNLSVEGEQRRISCVRKKNR